MPETVYVAAPTTEVERQQLTVQLEASTKDLDELHRRMNTLEGRLEKTQDDVKRAEYEKQLETLRDVEKRVKNYVDQLENAKEGKAPVEQKAPEGAQPPSEKSRGFVDTYGEGVEISSEA